MPHEDVWKRHRSGSVADIEREWHPLAEHPFDLVSRSGATRELVERLTHYKLSNGWLVSILHADYAHTWEVMVGPGDSLTEGPVYFDSKAGALAYRDEIRKRPPINTGG